MSLAGVSGCAAGDASSAAAERPKRPLYKPGQSLAARLCACRECFDAACCNGEPSDEPASSETELGIAVNACGRCVRRTWTARGDARCAVNAPERCCPDTMTD
ncbi:MAG: hypothetical protein QM756_21020 [Polyangiaceae bacterium]